MTPPYLYLVVTYGAIHLEMRPRKQANKQKDKEEKSYLCIAKVLEGMVLSGGPPWGLLGV